MQSRENVLRCIFIRQKTGDKGKMSLAFCVLKEIIWKSSALVKFFQHRNLVRVLMQCRRLAGWFPAFLPTFIAESKQQD